MKTMLTALLTVIGIVAVLAFTGCVTKGSATSDDTALIQRALDDVLPATFTGHAKFSHSNQYFDITIEADGLARTEKGWQWESLTYSRKSHFPFWSSSGDITLTRKGS